MKESNKALNLYENKVSVKSLISCFTTNNTLFFMLSGIM